MHMLPVTKQPKTISKRCLIPAATLILALCGSAAADECDAVNKSLVAAQALPGFDEKTTLTPEGKPASAMELITLGDAVYMKIGDRPWRKQVITAAARQDMNKKLMATMGPTGCTSAGNETLGGVPTTIYAYRQSIGGKLIDVKVWVGDSDGLPLKMLSKASSASFSYDNIVAPIP